MNYVVHIKPYTVLSSVLIINTEMARVLDLNRKKLCCLSFGSEKNFVQLNISDDISLEEVLISTDIINNLHIPSYPNYEINVKENEIVIGPYIGVLISKEDKGITKRRLHNLLYDMKEYSNLNGAIVIFALNKVNTTKRLIEGYCYNPEENSWERGLFPYPAAIYRRIGLSFRWKNYFLSAIGDTMFNSYYFDKWEMFEWLSNDDWLKNYLPQTILYQKYQDIFDMLNKYNEIFVKPIAGMQGNKIYKITSKANIINIFYRDKKENQQLTFTNIDEFKEFVLNKFYAGRYIIQKAIKLLNINNRVIDFRCIVQKNQEADWQCNGIIGRLGVEGSVVSNISNDGVALSIETLLRDTLNLNEQEIVTWSEEVISFACKTCKILDETGVNCGTVGLDLGIDIDGHLWLIEINIRDPDPTIALDANDKKLYSLIKTSPLFYAKGLAGFKYLEE